MSDKTSKAIAALAWALRHPVEFYDLTPARRRRFFEAVAWLPAEYAPVLLAFLRAVYAAPVRPDSTRALASVLREGEQVFEVKIEQFFKKHMQ